MTLKQVFVCLNIKRLKDVCSYGVHTSILMGTLHMLEILLGVFPLHVEE